MLPMPVITPVLSMSQSLVLMAKVAVFAPIVMAPVWVPVPILRVLPAEFILTVAPLIFMPAVPVIRPDALRVVIPLFSPAVATSKVLLFKAKVGVPLPIVMAPVWVPVPILRALPAELISTAAPLRLIPPVPVKDYALGGNRLWRLP